MKNILALLLAAFGLNTACSQNFENMEVKEFAELIADSNVVVLDVGGLRVDVLHIAGDMQDFGRVYIGTHGRGTIMGTEK